MGWVMLPSQESYWGRQTLRRRVNYNKHETVNSGEGAGQSEMCCFGSQVLWSRWLAVDLGGDIRARRLGDGGRLEAIGQGLAAVGKPAVSGPCRDAKS